MIQTSRIDNAPRFWPGETPFYEVYFFKFHLLDEGIAFWIRYTLHSPLHEEAYGALWAFALEEKESGLREGATQKFPMSAVQVGAQEFYLRMGEGEFSEGRLKGKAAEGRFTMEWDLRYESPVGAHGCAPLLKLYPYDWMYRTSFPKTKYLVPSPFALFSGRILVNGKEYSLKQNPGEQAHLWGKQHARAWAWVHCNTFLEDPTAVIEGLSAQIKIGPIEPPPFNLFCFRTGGKEYFFHHPLRWFRNRSAHSVQGWDFDAVQGEYRLMGSLVNDPQKMIGVRYTDPDGSHRFCNHAEWAELRLGLYRRVHKRWEELTSLHSRAATFEAVDLEPDPQVQVKVLG